MLLLIIPEGLRASSLDVANALADCVYRLGFRSLADLNGAESWVTAPELYGWADEAVKRISYESGVFLTLDDSIIVVAGNAVYAEPDSHVYTLAAALDAGPLPVPLRITTVRDLWALDAAWPTTAGPASRASMDAGAVGTITIYPIPTAGGTLRQVCEEYPAEVQAGASTVALPTVLQDYFGYAMLAGARGKESEAAMPEMAAHYRQRVAMYEQIIEHLWGPGQ